MRSNKEIDLQIEGLLSEKRLTPEYSMFGEPNHAIIDAQIEILKGEKTLDDFPFDEGNEIYKKAERATLWLSGDYKKNLYNENLFYDEKSIQ